MVKSNWKKKQLRENRMNRKNYTRKLEVTIKNHAHSISRWCVFVLRSIHSLEWCEVRISQLGSIWLGKFRIQSSFSLAFYSSLIVMMENCFVCIKHIFLWMLGNFLCFDRRIFESWGFDGILLICFEEMSLW